MSKLDYLDTRILRLESRLSDLESSDFFAPNTAYIEFLNLKIALLEKTLQLERLQHSIAINSFKNRKDGSK